VLAPERQPRNKMVQDEVVEHDDAGAAPEPFEDPAVDGRVVTHVIERDVAVRALPTSRDFDLEAPTKRGNAKRRVVADGGEFRRQRVVVRDSRVRSLSRAARSNSPSTSCSSAKFNMRCSCTIGSTYQ